MTDSPDMADLARRYMDMWQAHLTAVANDKDTAEVLAQTMALMSSGAQAFAAAAQPTASPAPEAGHDGADPATPGSASAAVADGGPGLERAQLLERLAALEERVAELESEAAGRRNGADTGDQQGGS